MDGTIYYSDIDGNGTDFEYDIDWDTAEEYILRTHSLDELLEDYLELLYPKLSDRDKEAASTYGFYGTKESIKQMDDYDKEDFLTTNGLFDLMRHTDIYDDELYDYFQDDAYELWKEWREG